MGYDITFHPVNPAEVDEFIFDTIKHPGKSRSNAERISPHENVRKAITGLFSELVQRYQEKMDMQALGYVAAAILGFLHPYWYARGACISFLTKNHPEYQGFLQSFSTLKPELFEGFTGTQVTQFSGNYTIGAYIPADKLAGLRKQLERDRLKIKEQDIFEEQELWSSVIHAIEYAEQRNMGLLEVTDVVIPMTSENWSNPMNYRAAHLKNELVLKNAREMDPTSPTARRFTNEQDA